MLLRISEVSAATGIAVYRIQYAVKQGQVKIDRPARRWARHWWTADEVRAVCDWFGVPEPQARHRPAVRQEGIPAGGVTAIME